MKRAGIRHADEQACADIARPGVVDIARAGCGRVAAGHAVFRGATLKASTAAIETHGLTKTYRTTSAVEDLDLVVEAGQVFGFLGPNGAGKTTTIRLLLALQRPTSGIAHVLGLDARHDQVEIHRQVGYLPGDLALYPRMTGRQHLDWFRRARGDQGDESLTHDLVERFDVVLDRPTKELSTGNRQKIGLVMAFMHRPKLVVLDEPTSGLDPLMQDEFERLAREVVADGRTIFLSSHELDEVQRMADRVGIIRAGRLLTTDTVENLRRNAPQRVEATFPHVVDRSRFDQIPGVSVTECQDNRVLLAVTGAIGPLLRAIGDLDPVDVVVRRANLDELFLDYYRGERSEVSDAR